MILRGSSLVPDDLCLLYRSSLLLLLDELLSAVATSKLSLLDYDILLVSLIGVVVETRASVVANYWNVVITRVDVALVIIPRVLLVGLPQFLLLSEMRVPMPNSRVADVFRDWYSIIVGNFSSDKLGLQVPRSNHRRLSVWTNLKLNLVSQLMDLLGLYDSNRGSLTISILGLLRGLLGRKIWPVKLDRALIVILLLIYFVMMSVQIASSIQMLDSGLLVVVVLILVDLIIVN